MLTPKQIIDQMYFNDPFSLWMGIVREEEGAGYCTLSMRVRKEMTNGFALAHGGISYSLADSALAFASNAHGYHAVSVNTSIDHLQRVVEGDTLRAVCKEIKRTNKLGWYDVKVYNQNEELVCLFKGLVYVKSTMWEKHDAVKS